MRWGEFFTLFERRTQFYGSETTESMNTTIDRLHPDSRTRITGTCSNHLINRGQVTTLLTLVVRECRKYGRTKSK